MAGWNEICWGDREVRIFGFRQMVVENRHGPDTAQRAFLVGRCIPQLVINRPRRTSCGAQVVGVERDQLFFGNGTDRGYTPYKIEDSSARTGVISCCSRGKVWTNRVQARMKLGVGYRGKTGGEDVSIRHSR